MSIDTGYQGNDDAGALGHAKKAFEEARAFREAVQEKAGSVSRSIDLRGRVQDHPIAMVCAAAGIGYLLGGGLFTPTTARILRYGLRLALIPILKAQLPGILGAQPGEGSAGSTF